MQPSETSDSPEGKILDRQQKESLISMIALLFVDEHNLLNTEQLEDARKSLQALFLRTTGEETMLRKLIDILRTNKALNQTFNDMATVLSGITKSTGTIKSKIDGFKQQLQSLEINAEENADFIGPFLEFSGQFVDYVEQFERMMYTYRDVKEREARYASMFRIAKEARQRLKDRFSGGPGEEGETENKIKEKVINTFDYGETEINLGYAQREARNTLAEIEALINKFQIMCQFAMNPDMREQEKGYQPFKESDYHDVFSIYTAAVAKHPRLSILKQPIQDLFRLYQHSYGMFALDFQKFNRAIMPMEKNTKAYFMAKEEDDDVRIKRRKLEQIEGLITFLENVAQLLRQEREFVYARFSKAVSDVVTTPGAKWAHIAEDLLRMKVSAEADLSTRLS
jgi:archaellum component FlaC